MMKIHPIKIAADKLPSSIYNTAREYPEGRDILLRCLSRNSKRTIMEVVEWLKGTDIEIFELDSHKLDDTY